MKRYIFPSVLGLGVLFPLLALADDNQEFINFLVASIGGMKGMGTLAIIGLVVQILIKLMNLKIFDQFFSKLDGETKLLIVSGLTFVSGPILLMTRDNLSFGAAMIHSATLTAFMVYFNQIYQHFFAKKV